jgi:hypothetical protein
MTPIETLQNKLISNYETMIATCELHIKNGHDVLWWADMKSRIAVKLIETTSKKPSAVIASRDSEVNATIIQPV